VTGASLHQILEPVNPLKGAIFEYVLVNKFFLKTIASWEQLMIIDTTFIQNFHEHGGKQSVAIRPE